MNRTRRTNSTNKRQKQYTEKNHQYKRNKGNNKNIEKANDIMNPEARDNDPNWYYLDKQVAEQVSALSFQNLAGINIDMGGHSVKVPNIAVWYLNPCPGVQTDPYTNNAGQKSAVNLAGFRTFSKLSAYTGRQATYGPQDISTMILAFGELISTIEWVRRAFGVSYTMSMRNRDYPKKVLEAMAIDPDNLFANRANYVTEFNKIITRVNQLPIPKNIAYFDKCASLYEKIYLDSNSSMAQTIIPSIATTWILDETSYSGGSILKTQDWGYQYTSGLAWNPQNLSVYLNRIDSMIDALMNSSTLQVVFTDLLNLASKTGAEFWKFDYMRDDYAVFPEYNLNFLLQYHNCTLTGIPFLQTDDAYLSSSGITPYNDVYPNANDNAIWYNPAFGTIKDSSGTPITVTVARTDANAIIDMITDSPTLEDRVEVTRYTSLGKSFISLPGGYCSYNMALPDHYVTSIRFYFTSGAIKEWEGSIMYYVASAYVDVVQANSMIDWSPQLYFNNASGQIVSGISVGDLNYYTVVDTNFIRRLHDFVGLALYDLR